MADDAALLETEMRNNEEEMKKIRRQLDELGPSDMGKNSQLQKDLRRRMDKQERLNDRWEKALTGQSPER